MDKQFGGFSDELRLSPVPILALLVALGNALILLAEGLALPTPITALGGILIMVSALVGMVHQRDRDIGRWGLIVLVGMVIMYGAHVAAFPGALGLLVVPVLLAATVIGPRAASVTAATLTVAVIVACEVGAVAGGCSRATIPMVLVWSSWALARAYQERALRLAEWSAKQYQMGQSLQEEMKNRSQHLSQVMKDLAQVNRQVSLTNEKLAAARWAAEEAKKTKAAFVSNVSHEFRTPLNMIIGMTALLIDAHDIYDQAVPTALLEDLEIVHRNSVHLADMVNDVLDLSQVEAGRMALRREWTDLGEIIARSIDVVRPLLSRKNLALYVEIDDDLPKAYCDPIRIRQVIVNLLSNAARFTEKGGIEVQAGQEAQYVVVKVHDSGPGLSEEQSTLVFEPFRQAGLAGSEEAQGTGLGLSISKEFVELHGGRMWLESQVGVGSIFAFRLPVSPALDHTASPARWLSEDWVWTDRQIEEQAELPVVRDRGRVLVCDGSGETSALLGRYEDRVDFVPVADVDDAVAELRRFPAQAVLMNAATPDEIWQRVEICRQRIQDTPILGCAIPLYSQSVHARGALDYVAKPVTPERLRAALGRLPEKPRRVLIVDDEPDGQRLLERMLKVCGLSAQVAVASDGQAGLELFATWHPDLVLLDIVLPDMTGWQFLKGKDDRCLESVPVIVVSAHDPRDRPLESLVLMGTIGQGLSISRLLCCSQMMIELLAGPD